MSTARYALFETAIGTCAVAWGQAGIRGVFLPESDPERTRARVLRRLPAAVEAEPSPEIARAVDGMSALLRGEAVDLSGVKLDTSGQDPFHVRAAAVARTIPPGQVMTYGQIAARLGEPQAAQAVGQAMGKNPFPIIVPCHRVVAAGGKMGGFSAPGGGRTKLKMLEIEGALRPDALPLFAGAASPPAPAPAGGR
jgi:methylated-DNA-[protein]-cysteine S-methyltransferase